MPQDVHGVQGLTLSGRVGWRYSNEYQSSFTEGGVAVTGGRVELGQVVLAGEASYVPDLGIEQVIEVVASAEGNIDAVRSERDRAEGFAGDSDDRTDVILGLRINALLAEGVTADLGYTHMLSREDSSDIGVSAGLRFEF